MTNLQDGASRLSGPTLRRFWFLVPLGALGGLGVLVILAGLLPLWASLQRDTQRLQELEQFRDQVTLLRSQQAAIREKAETASASKDKIVKLITGNGDLSTFLAMLDREARASGVQLNLYEPTGPAPAPANAPPAAAPPPPAPAPGAPAPAPGAGAAPAGPVALEGLSQRFLLVSARGRFPALLAFLRRLEALNVLVVQTDLSLTLSDEQAAGGKPLNPDIPVVMKLTLGLYSRQAAAAPVPGAPAPPAPAAPAPSSSSSSSSSPSVDRPISHANTTGSGMWPFRPSAHTIRPIWRSGKRGKTSVATRSSRVFRPCGPAAVGWFQRGWSGRAAGPFRSLPIPA